MAIKYKARQDVIIKEADKKGAVKIWDGENYIFETNKQLYDNNICKKIFQGPKPQRDSVNNSIKYFQSFKILNKKSS